MNDNRRILVLYTELAAYITNCLELLADSGFEVKVVAWPVNTEAPFEFSGSQNTAVHYLSRKDFDTSELLKFARQFDPSVILCSGWIDRGYLTVCAALKHRARCILALDNKWVGNLKQKLISTAGRVIIRTCFSYCWVPGPQQRQYALKLGFSNRQILDGFYTADTTHFHNLYKKYLPEKANNFPRRYLYVGRYTEFKGVIDLWEAHRRKQNSKWELWCAGTGPLFEERPQLPGLKHMGFVQPAQMDKFVKETSVFIMPSHKEPWGVALHEFAAAGFPLLCSTKVGAASLFLREGLNGFSFKPGNPENILEVMNQIEDLSVENLLQMGKISSSLAAVISPQLWVQKLISMHKEIL